MAITSCPAALAGQGQAPPPPGPRGSGRGWGATHTSSSAAPARGAPPGTPGPGRPVHVSRWPAAPSAAGGPVTLYNGVFPQGITVDNAAVYWVVEGNVGMSNGSVMKLAK